MSNKKSTKDKISITDIQNLEQELEGNMAKDRVYWLRNDAKLRAVYTSQSYDEFRDIVDAAHLQPLEKKDRLNSASHTTVWNSVTNKKDEEECE